MAYNFANYFQKQDNVISWFAFIPQEHSFNKQKQYEFIHNLIEIFENRFLSKKISVSKIKISKEESKIMNFWFNHHFYCIKFWWLQNKYNLLNFVCII